MQIRPPRRGPVDAGTASRAHDAVWRLAAAVAVATTVVVAACSSSAPAPTAETTTPPATPGPLTDPAALTWQRTVPDPAVWGSDAATMVFGSAVVPGGGPLVAVGVDRRASPSTAAVFTSTDGVDYQRVDPAAVHAGTATLSAETAMRDVVATPTGLVAVGFDFSPTGADVPASTDANGAEVGATRSAVWRSTDARTWDRVGAGPDAALASSLMTHVIEIPGGLLALGQEPQTGAGIAWTSPDGTTWQRIPAASGLTGAGKVAFQTAAVTPQGILVAGSVRVGETRSAAMWRSTDALTWLPVESPSFTASPAQEIAAVVAFRGGLVAGGAATEEGTDAAAVWTSPDGSAWTRVPHDEATFGGAGGDAITLVLVVGDGVLALGRSSPGRLDPDAAVWTSTDARNWRREPAPAEIFGGPNTEEFLTAAVVADRVAATGRSKRADRDTLRFVDSELMLWFAQEPR